MFRMYDSNHRFIRVYQVRRRTGIGGSPGRAQAGRAAAAGTSGTEEKRGSEIQDEYIADTTEFQIEEPTIVTLGKFW